MLAWDAEQKVLWTDKLSLFVIDESRTKVGC